MKNMKKSIFLLFLVLVVSFSMIACSNDKQDTNNNVEKTVEDSKPEQTKYPLVIKDSYDREVTIEQEPESIVSVAPNITETIYALDKGETLTGRTDFDDYPEQVTAIESIGSLTDPNLEKIVEIKPDLVLASTHFKKEVVEKLEEAGIKVAVFYEKENFDGTYKVIEDVGKVINAQDEAQNVIEDMKKTVEEVNDKVKDKEKKSTYYVVGFGEGGEFTAGKDTFIGEVIEMAGGKNSADDVDGWSYSLEKLVENDPDLLVVPNRTGEKEKLMNTNGYKDLTAVKQDKVYEIDDNLLSRQGPRLSEGLLELAKIIHPDAFN